ISEKSKVYSCAMAVLLTSDLPLTTRCDNVKATWLLRLRIGEALPRARGIKRLSTVPLLTVIFSIKRETAEAPFALLKAERRSFASGPEARFGSIARIESAWGTLLPLLRSATSRTLRGACR